MHVNKKMRKTIEDFGILQIHESCIFDAQYVDVQCRAVLKVQKNVQLQYASIFWEVWFANKMIYLWHL